MSIAPQAMSMMTLTMPMTVDDVLLSVAHVRFLIVADSFDFSTKSSFLLIFINSTIVIDSFLHMQGHHASILLSVDRVPFFSLFCVVFSVDEPGVGQYGLVVGYILLPAEQVEQGTS